MQPAIRKIFVSLGYLVSALVFLTGVLVVITFFLTAALNRHHADFEKTVSDILQRPIKVQTMNIGWYHYYYPEIDLEQVTVLDQQTQTPKLRINRLRMNFNLWNSLWHWKVMISNITLSGVDITIKQEDSGQIKIANLISFNMRDQYTGALLQPNEIQRWILAQRRLALENIRIHLITPTQPERFVSLDYIILRNDGMHHVINGQVSLQQKKPATLKVHFDWMGDVDQYLIASGDLQLDLNNFSLSHWLSEIKWQGYEVQKGIISGTLLVTWKNNQWVTSQLNVNGKNIALEGTDVPMQFNVDQISSNMSLSNTTKVVATGKIDIINGNLNSTGNKIALTNANGTLTIAENNITANNISAQLLNAPATLNITSSNDAHEWQIGVVSQMTVTEAEKLLQISISKYARGSVNYQAQLSLSQSKPNSALITSDLRGLIIDAPSGLGKSATEAKDLIVNLTMPDTNSINVKASYAKSLNASTTLKKINNKYEPSNLNLNAEKLNIAGQTIHKADINLVSAKDSWQMKIKSDELAGDLNIPTRFAGNILSGHLQYLHLDTSSASGTQATTAENPADLPALSLDCDDVRINSYSLGHVKLSTVPGNNGMIIRELSIRDNDVQFNASGDWIGSHTRLQGELSSPQISSLLKKWNLNVSNFSGSTANIQFNLNWNGPAYDLSLSKLNGNLSLRLGAGNITGLSQSTNAKIGMANLLNLFSLSSLPGLNVHPTNSAQSGYSFTSLTANFELRSGNAFTDDMIFHSTIAEVTIKGRLGLAAEDFDLRMGVKPQMTGSLPLVATLAGGPIAGAATWVASQVMSSAPSPGSTYQYRVSGPWSRPSMSKE